MLSYRPCGLLRHFSATERIISQSLQNVKTLPKKKKKDLLQKLLQRNIITSYLVDRDESDESDEGDKEDKEGG